MRWTDRARQRSAPRVGRRLRDPDGMALKVYIGGPMTDAEGVMIGTMLVIEAASQDVMERFVTGDPYSKAGIYAQVDIRPYTWGLGQPREVVYG